MGKQKWRRRRASYLKIAPQENKDSNRMGGHMNYVTADNRDFLLALVRGLEKA